MQVKTNQFSLLALKMVELKTWNNNEDADHEQGGARPNRRYILFESQAFGIYFIELPLPAKCHLRRNIK